MNLFSFNTIFTKLEKSNRTLFITLNREDKNNCINLECLSEIEKTLRWANSRPEIINILFNSSTLKYSEGITGEKKDDQYYLKIRALVAKIHHLMLAAPAQIIFDFNQGACDLSIDLSLAADLRVASKSCKIELNHNAKNLIPFFSHQLIKQVYSANWLRKVYGLKKTEELIDLNYANDNREQFINNTLINFSKMPNILRIQSKLLWGMNLVFNNNEFKKEQEVFHAAISNFDKTTKQITENISGLEKKSFENKNKMTLIQGGLN